LNQDKTNNKLVESLLLITIMTVLGIVGLSFIPYLFLFPAVFTIFALRNGSNLSFINIIITGIAVGILGDLGGGIFILVTSLPMTFIFVNLIIKRVKSSEIILIATIFSFISLLLLIKLMDLNGINLVKLLEEGFNETMSKQLDIYQGMGLTSLELNEKVDFLESTYKYALLIIPSLMFIISLIVSYLNYVVIVIGLEKMELRLANTPRFSKFRLPNNFIATTALVLLAFMFMRRLESPYLDTIIINIQILIGFAFTIQGLSVIEHILVRRGVKLWVRTISYTLFAFLPPMITILPLIGAGDIVFDFKKLKKPKSR